MISRRRNRIRPAVFLVAGILLSTVGCAREQPAATPANITTADLKKLSWIEGTWRGPATGQRRSMNAIDFRTTIRSSLRTWLTTAQGAVKRTTRYELKAGALRERSSVAIRRPTAPSRSIVERIRFAGRRSRRMSGKPCSDHQQPRRRRPQSASTAWNDGHRRSSSSELPPGASDIRGLRGRRYCGPAPHFALVTTGGESCRTSTGNVRRPRTLHNQ